MRTTESYIKVSNEARAKLARLFNVEEKTIYLALTYRRNSDKMRKIRYTAVRVDILNKLPPYGLFKLTPIDNL